MPTDATLNHDLRFPSMKVMVAMLVLLTGCSPPAGDRTTTRVEAPIAWEQRASMDVARSENPAVVIEDTIYAIGGLVSTAQGMGATPAVDRYQPETDTWESVEPLPAARHHSMAVALGGRIYHLGGMDNSGFNPVALSWALDPASGWSQIADIPQPAGAGVAVAIDGLVYVAGGVAGGSSLFAYDPTTDSWGTLTGMEQSREHIAAVAYKGKLWVLGGRWGTAMLKTVEIYDPATARWSEGPPMMEARSGFGATVIGDRIIVAGGEVFSPTRALSSVETFDGETWIQGEPLPTPLHGMPLVTVDDSVYVIGGSETAADVDNPGEVWLLRP